MYKYNVFQADSCPPEIFQFRYEVYVEELHRKQSYADHKARTIIDPLDKTARQGVVTKDGEIIAVVRLNMVRDGSIAPYDDLYEINKLSPDKQATACICTRNMVRKDHRKTGIAIRMLKMIYEHGIRSGATDCYMDVNEPMIPLFAKMGYISLFEKDHPDYGLVTVMRLPATDLAYLEAARSPFAPICRKFFEEQGIELPE